MRNPDLDKKLPLDEEISELTEDGKYRTVNGKLISQIEEKTQADIDKNLIINRYRASGMRLSDYLKNY